MKKRDRENNKDAKEYDKRKYTKKERERKPRQKYYF